MLMTVAAKPVNEPVKRSAVISTASEPAATNVADMTSALKIEDQRDRGRYDRRHSSSHPP